MGSLFGPFVLRVRTNLCSVTGKTGMGGKAVGRGARGSGLPSPARRVFRGACHVETSIYRVSTFFVVHSAASRHCEERSKSKIRRSQSSVDRTLAPLRVIAWCGCHDVTALHHTKVPQRFTAYQQIRYPTDDRIISPKNKTNSLCGKTAHDTKSASAPNPHPWCGCGRREAYKTGCATSILVFATQYRAG